MADRPANDSEAHPFLNAQAADPFDPAPMLIYADWLEESGDQAGAAALRGLAGAGITSIVAISLDAANAPLERMSPGGIGDGFSTGPKSNFVDGVGFGDKFGNADGAGYGARDEMGIADR